MKWIRFGLVPVLALTLATVALADDKTQASKPASTTKPASTAKQGGGDWNKSPDEMAKKSLDKWQGVLKLTDDQKPQFESIMKDSYQKMADAKTAAGGDKTKMKASAQTIMADRDAALAKVLTPDQMKTYNAQMAKMSSEAKKKWNKDASKDTKDADKDEKYEKK